MTATSFLSLRSGFEEVDGAEETQRISLGCAKQFPLLLLRSASGSSFDNARNSPEFIGVLYIFRVDDPLSLILEFENCAITKDTFESLGQPLVDTVLLQEATYVIVKCTIRGYVEKYSQEMEEFEAPPLTAYNSTISIEKSEDTEWHRDSKCRLCLCRMPLYRFDKWRN